MHRTGRAKRNPPNWGFTTESTNVNRLKLDVEQYESDHNGSCMILSFRGKDTQALFEGKVVRRFKKIARIAERELAQLHAAQTLEFLRAPPGNMLELLKGNRKGQHSIRVNDQW